jgi:hypothetical protein
MLAERHAKAQQLLQMVKQVMEAQQATNVFEFVASSETVLRNTLTMLGLPVPDPVPGSVFSNPDDDGLGSRGSR